MSTHNPFLKRFLGMVFGFALTVALLVGISIWYGEMVKNSLGRGGQSRVAEFKPAAGLPRYRG
jgi:hypothetical protein